MNKDLRRQTTKRELKHFFVGRYVAMVVDVDHRFYAFLLQVLLEILSQDVILLSPKRVKFLLIPLKLASKTSKIALNQLTVWWSLICKVENQMEEYYDSILIPFLRFCFALNDKQPLLSRVNEDRNCQEL